MSRAADQPKAPTGSLCASQGHLWRNTASPSYRTCCRERCRAAERLVNETWIEATHTPSRRPRRRVALAPTPLWGEQVWQQTDECTASSALMRRLEGQYHTLLGH